MVVVVMAMEASQADQAAAPRYMGYHHIILLAQALLPRPALLLQQVMLPVTEMPVVVLLSLGQEQVVVEQAE